MNVPLLIGLGLSVAIHVAALYGKGIYTPPKPSLEQGRTVVRLTLIPSISSKENPSKGDIDVAPTPVPQAARLPEPTPPPEQPQTPTPKNSSDQDASLIEDKGVTVEAQPFKTINPTYPRISRLRGEEGTVILSIKITARGKVSTVSVVQSSGHSRLDKAALKTIEKTIFTPAQQFGRAIDSTTELSFTFQLTHD